MVEQEIIAAMKQMFAEERKNTDARFDAIDARFAEERKRSDDKFAEAQKKSDAKFAEAQKNSDAKFAEAQKKSDAKFAEAQKNSDARFAAERKRSDDKFAALEAKIDATQRETIRQIKVLLENGDEKKIRLLAEGQKQILERLPQAEEQRGIKGRVATLERVVANHTQRIQKLEQA